MIDLLTDFFDTMVVMYDRNFPRFLFILACIVINGILILRFLSSLFFPAKQKEEVEQEPIVQEEASSAEEPASIEYTHKQDTEEYKQGIEEYKDILNNLHVSNREEKERKPHTNIFYLSPSFNLYKEVY